MGASLFKPECAPPVFQMASAEVAGECGHWNGMVLAVILSIIVLIVGVVIFNTASQGETTTYVYNGQVRTKTEKPKKKYWILGVTAGIIILLLFGIPAISGWSNKQQFRGAQVQIKNLEAQGLDHQQAMAKVQDYKQQQMRAAAVSDAGMNVAAALWSRN